MKTIDIIIPLYNEEENLHSIVEHIRQVLANNFERLTFILVDDGSKDSTEEKAQDLLKNVDDTEIKYICLARNFGQDLAIKCGIDHSQSDICAMIDADFQQPPEKILEAAKLLESGYNIVHVMKKERTHGSAYRKYGSHLFNRLIDFLSGMKIHLTDFKVLDKTAVNLIKSYTENFYFSRGIVDMVGLQATTIEYIPQTRMHGESKYSMASLIKLAVNSIISASIKPLRISIYLGLSISVFSFFYALFILTEKLFHGQPIPGFPTLATALFFLSGIQLLFLGIIGEYLGKTFIETKKRPQYLVKYIKASRPVEK